VLCFEAEDGIGDWSVTGVQTCALPIWQRLTAARPPHARRSRNGIIEYNRKGRLAGGRVDEQITRLLSPDGTAASRDQPQRLCRGDRKSVRVGKEGRSRGETRQEDEK